MAGMTIQLEGVERLHRALDSDRLITKPAKKALAEIGKIGKSEAKGGAPRLSGKLSSSIGYRVESHASYVKVNVTARRGSVSYPRILEFSGKYGHKGWFMTQLKDVGRWASKVLNDFADDIEKAWGGR